MILVKRVASLCGFPNPNSATAKVSDFAIPNFDPLPSAPDFDAVTA
jgi:hypothetical protein